MTKGREIYGFTHDQKEYAKRRANGHCEFPGESCGGIPTGRVSHLTGCGIAIRLNRDPSAITNIDYNGLLLCEPCEISLDEQERALFEKIARGESQLPYAVEIIIYETGKPRVYRLGQETNTR